MNRWGGSRWSKATSYLRTFPLRFWLLRLIANGDAVVMNVDINKDGYALSVSTPGRSLFCYNSIIQSPIQPPLNTENQE